MAAIAVAPIILKDVSFSVASDDYEAHVSQVEFVPSSSTVNWKGLTPSSVFSFGTNATWVCNLSFAQDWETTNSLSKYLFANEGTEVAVTFEPKSGGAAFSATLIIAPGSIGGTVDSVAVSTVSLGVKGKPALTPAE